jgi:DNA gyrase subunit A
LPIKEYKEGLFVVSVTEQGYIKKTDLMAYAQLRQTGIIGLKLEDNDRLVSCRVTSGKDDLIIATRMGKAIRFPEEEVRPMGRSSRGVTGIRFGEEGDAVIGLEVIQGEDAFLSVCENGYGKRTPIEEYRVQSRGGKGIYTIKVTERNGAVVGVMQVADDNHLMVLTSSGKVIRFVVNEVGLIGRLTQGVRLVNLDEGERIISMTRIQQIEGEEV